MGSSAMMMEVLVRLEPAGRIGNAALFVHLIYELPPSTEYLMTTLVLFGSVEFQVINEFLSIPTELIS